ncbi:MAG TPA: peptidase dimerization domain-containing protein, partial [Acidimicrobiales bacterium]|nr:peptidase dimerization domain-containing protein [Acidimicrobiales bacterium]
LSKLLDRRPALLAADAAVLGEPTGGLLEAGCQGTLRLDVTLVGERAHTARPWMGRNAVHRLAPLLERCARYEGRRPVLDGCEYQEALQAVHVEGGVATNVVPDVAHLRVNHRYAPDRSAAEAFDHLRRFFGDTLDEAAGDGVALADHADGALPNLGHPLLAALAGRVGSPPRAKLGWTDVAFFAARGIPAANFGPGDPTVAHTAAERVHRHEMETVYSVLRTVVEGGPGA